jgi:hypothetical protein
MLSVREEILDGGTFLSAWGHAQADDTGTG